MGWRRNRKKRVKGKGDGGRREGSKEIKKFEEDNYGCSVIEVEDEKSMGK